MKNVLNFNVYIHTVHSNDDMIILMTMTDGNDNDNDLTIKGRDDDIKIARERHLAREKTRTYMGYGQDSEGKLTKTRKPRRR